MVIMTIEEYRKWVEEEGFPLTKNVCQKCDRRTDFCRDCNEDCSQPERLSEMGSKE